MKVDKLGIISTASECKAITDLGPSPTQPTLLLLSLLCHPLSIRLKLARTIMFDPCRLESYFIWHPRAFAYPISSRARPGWGRRGRRDIAHAR
jgi:hypothetical protein